MHRTLHITLVAAGIFAGIFAGAAPSQVIIEKGAATSGLARTMNNNDNSIALTPDGAMWAIIHVVDSSGSNGHLQLRRSLTHGSTWLTGTYALPNNTAHNNHHNNSGCIVAGREGDRLHVTWADKTAAPGFWSAMYQEFDTQSLTWVGTPTLLAKGSTANNQFWPVDIDVTPKGTVVVCISGHRAGGLGLGSWDCGLAVKTRGGSFNSTLINLRNGGASYSQNASIVAIDETIHCCMKNNTGGYGICYRSYDTETSTWDQSTQVYVGPNNNASIAAGNKSVIAGDRAGGRYILYVTGNTTAARTLRLAYAPPGKGSANADWQDIHIIPNTQTLGTNYRSSSSTSGDYPLIQGGNTTYRNYTLSSGAGDVVTVIYSKAFETFTNLYMQSFKAGVSVLPEIKVSPSGTKPYSYEWLTGLRAGDHTFLATWLSYGRTDAPSPNNGTYPNGQVDFWRTSNTSIGRTVAFGFGCQGLLPSRPRMHAHDTLPTIGNTFNVNMDRYPASANFFLAVGLNISLPPLQLGFMGAPGCAIDIDFPIIVGLAVNASGTLTVPWNVPNDTNLVGARVLTQSLVVVPNSTQVVTTNALAVVIGK